MIKKKIEFKQIEGSSISSKLSVAGLDGWYLTSPIINTGHSHLVALVSREVDVTKDNLSELILGDFKSEVGSILCQSHNRLGTFIDNKKAQEFMTNTARRYKTHETTVNQILIQNLEAITWVKDDE